jgi:hypothetical protein
MRAALPAAVLVVWVAVLVLAVLLVARTSLSPARVPTFISGSYVCVLDHQMYDCSASHPLAMRGPK